MERDIEGGLGSKEGVPKGECASVNVVEGLGRFMDAEELLRLYAAGERDFAGIDLRVTDGYSLSIWIKLSGADLRGSNLRGANLFRANLSGANLSDASLFGASLSHANLIGADLSNADLRGANLSSANLRLANLSHADLSGANLRLASLRTTNLSHADLSHTNLTGANLLGATGDWRFVGTYNALFWDTTMPDGSVKVDPEESAK